MVSFPLLVSKLLFPLFEEEFLLSSAQVIQNRSEIQEMGILKI